MLGPCVSAEVGPSWCRENQHLFLGSAGLRLQHPSSGSRAPGGCGPQALWDTCASRPVGKGGMDGSEGGQRARGRAPRPSGQVSRDRTGGKATAALRPRRGSLSP